MAITKEDMDFWELVKRTNILKLMTGLAILTAFMFQVVGLMFIDIPKDNRDLVLQLNGMIDGAFVGGMVSYYFGSSKKEHDLTNDNRDPSKPSDKP